MNVWKGIEGAHPLCFFYFAAFSFTHIYRYYNHIGRVAQRLEHRAYTSAVVSSILTAPISFPFHNNKPRPQRYKAAKEKQ